MKYLCAALIAMMVLCFSACSTPDDSTSDSTEMDNSETILLNDNFETDNLNTIWNIVNVSGVQEWYRYQYSSNFYAKMNGYSGGPVANEDWLINSSALDLSGYNSVTLSFFNNKGFQTQPNKIIALLISSDYDGSSSPPDTGATWTDITDQATWSSGDFNGVSSGNIDLSSYIGENSIYIGFKYVSTDSINEEWQIDDLIITAK